jgi:hypothetical protein
MAFFADPPDSLTRTTCYISWGKSVILCWVPFPGKVRGQGFKTIVLTGPLPRAIRAAGTKLSPVGDGILPFISPLAKPVELFAGRRSNKARCEASVPCRVPLSGYLWVYVCEVVIGSELCHPLGVSSVRFCLSITYLSQGVIQKRSGHNQCLGVSFRWDPPYRDYPSITLDPLAFGG